MYENKERERDGRVAYGDATETSTGRQLNSGRRFGSKPGGGKTGGPGTVNQHCGVMKHASISI
jgi:hypothetical protein